MRDEVNHSEAADPVRSAKCAADWFVRRRPACPVEMVLAMSAAGSGAGSKWEHLALVLQLFLGELLIAVRGVFSPPWAWARSVSASIARP